MNNEVHIQSLRSEIAEAAATKFTDEPFCQSPIPPRSSATYNGADTPPLLRAGSHLPSPGFAGDDSFTFENESLARTSLTRTVTLNHAAASSSGGGEGTLLPAVLVAAGPGKMADVTETEDPMETK